MIATGCVTAGSKGSISCDFLMIEMATMKESLIVEYCHSCELQVATIATSCVTAGSIRSTFCNFLAAISDGSKSDMP